MRSNVGLREDGERPVCQTGLLLLLTDYGVNLTSTLMQKNSGFHSRQGLSGNR